MNHRFHGLLFQSPAFYIYAIGEILKRTDVAGYFGFDELECRNGQVQ
jgi:hypothetical protein